MEKKKKNYALQKGIAASLVTFAIATGAVRLLSNGEKVETKVFDENEISIEDTINTSITEKQIREFSKVLYEEYINKGFEQKIAVDWNKDLARSIIELANGIYPTTYEDLSTFEQKEKMDELINFIKLLEDENMNIATNNEDIINLSNYVVDPMIRVIMNNSLMIGRKAVCELNNETFNGKMINNVQHISSLNRTFNNSFDLLMDYQWETINSTDLLQSSNAETAVITTIWKSMNKNLPKWYFIERDMSEIHKDEHMLYYRYFIDVEDYMPYYPRLNELNELEYALTYYDEYGCHEKVYTEAEMYALAGLEEYYKGTYPYEETSLEPNVNIHQFGLEVEVENRYYEAVKYLSNLEIDADEKDNDNSLLLNGAVGLGACALGLGIGATVNKVKSKKK